MPLSVVLLFEPDSLDSGSLAVLGSEFKIYSVLEFPTFTEVIMYGLRSDLYTNENIYNIHLSFSDIIATLIKFEIPLPYYMQHVLYSIKSKHSYIYPRHRNKKTNYRLALNPDEYVPIKRYFEYVYYYLV